MSLMNFVSVVGEDFVAGPYFVTFSVGDALPARRCINIMTIDDENVEGDQEFTVAISTIGLPDSVSTVDPSMQTAKLIDNDSKCIYVYYTSCAYIIFCDFQHTICI